MKGRSFSDLDAFPKCDVTLDLLCVRLRLRVVPRGVGVGLTAGNDIVIACGAFPAADAVRFGRFEMILNDAVRGEVVISLDDDCVIALSNDGVVPCSFHVYLSLKKKNLTQRRK